MAYYASVEASRCKEGEKNNQINVIICWLQHCICAEDVHRSAPQTDWDSKQLLQVQGTLSGQV